MKSRQQLVYRTLQKLKVLAAGQEPSAEDYKVVDDDLVPVLSGLSARSIYPFGDPDQIEDEAFVHLATCLAASCSNDFGAAPLDPSMSNEQAVQIAENKLREIYAPTLSRQPLQVDYF